MLALMGIPFVVRTGDVDESQVAGEAPAAYLDRVTRAKLDAVRASRPGSAGGGVGAVAGGLVIAAGVLVADTIVVAPGGAILGKPRDPAEARAMIERLAGATHEVSTRFLLAPATASAPPVHGQTVTTRVTMRAVDAAEAEGYAATGEGLDKAGGYAVQGRAAAFVERIEGSYTNVVGLPLSEVVVALRALGWWGA
jgi:septum formation protein